MPQTRRIQVAFAKLEVTEGTDPVPTGPDALQLVEPATLSWGAEVPNPRDDQHNQFLEPVAPLAPSYPWAEITLRLYQRGKGAAYATTAGPEPHALIQAAGFSAVFTTDRWDYDTLSAVAGGLKTVTIYAFQGLDTGVHVLHKILAGRVTRLRFGYSAGGLGTIEVTVRGEYVAPSDTVVIAPSYMTAAPPRWAAAASWALGSFSTGLIGQASVTIENTPGFRENANAASTRYLLTGRRLLWDVTVEAARIADYDPFAKYISQVQEALVVAIGAVAQNNRIVITADRAQISDPPRYEERNGLMRFALSGVLDPGGTNRCKIAYVA